MLKKTSFISSNKFSQNLFSSTLFLWSTMPFLKDVNKILKDDAFYSEELNKLDEVFLKNAFEKQNDMIREISQNAGERLLSISKHLETEVPCYQAELTY